MVYIYFYSVKLLTPDKSSECMIGLQSCREQWSEVIASGLPKTVICSPVCGWLELKLGMKVWGKSLYLLAKFRFN